MAGTPPEDVLEWLTREEERLGTEAVERATLDIDEARKLLYSELGYDPTESQLEAWMRAGTTKYETLPQLGVELIPLKRPWGTQFSYYDYARHRFTKVETVIEAIRKWY